MVLSAREFEDPTIEVFNAEVSKLWFDQHENEMGGYRVYRVKLKTDEDEFTCTVSSPLKNVWFELEQGTSYEFEVTRSRTRCYINKAIKLEAESLLAVSGE